MVKDTPAWANGDRDESWAPSDPRDYDAFLTAVARRYPDTRYWMVWGETTRSSNFKPMPAHSPVGPRRYAVLLDSAYATLKRLKPANVVIGAMTWTVGQVTAPEFVRWLRLPDGRPPQMDFWGHNPYATRSPDLARTTYDARVRDFSDIDTLHHEIAAVYGPTGHVPGLWLSEFSVATDRKNRGFDFIVSRREQAHWLRAAYREAARAPYVAGLGWFELLDDAPKVRRGLTNGLMTSDGVPKPALRAYAAAP